MVSSTRIVLGFTSTLCLCQDFPRKLDYSRAVPFVGFPTLSHPGLLRSKCSMSLWRRQPKCSPLQAKEDNYSEEVESVALLQPYEDQGNDLLDVQTSSKHDTTLTSPSPGSNGNDDNQLWRSIGQGVKETPPWAIFLLNIVAVIWGSQHAVIKMVVDDSDAGSFTLLRFGLATLLASYYTPGLSSLLSNDKTDDETQKDGDGDKVQTAWRWGTEMGMWMFLGFAFQAVGLSMTTAQRSGFLLYLNVKFVPFFARFLMGREISYPTWISAFVAFFGTTLLALDGQAIAFNEGDVWSIGAAAASAMFILRLETASKEVPDSAQLNAACLWVVTILSFLWTFCQAFMKSGSINFETINAVSNQLLDVATSHPLELIYLGGITTALANYIQTKAQKEITAERASVIYSLDPVYGAVFSSVLLGESLGGTQAMFGAGLITIAAASNAFLDFTDSKKASTRE